MDMVVAVLIKVDGWVFIIVACRIVESIIVVGLMPMGLIPIILCLAITVVTTAVGVVGVYIVWCG